MNAINQNFQVQTERKLHTFFNLDEARDFCNRYFAAHNIVLAITAVPAPPKRIKRITSHSGHARFLASVESTNLVIPRIAEIPSPYAYSPTHSLYRTLSGSLLFIVETAHKQYDVFTVPTDVTPTVEVA